MAGRPDLVFLAPQTYNLRQEWTGFLLRAEGKEIVAGMTMADKRAEQQTALEKIRGGLATKVRILAHRDACPFCLAMEGVYEFDEVPQLPHEECSHPNGCRCFYAPVLDYYGP